MAAAQLQAAARRALGWLREAGFDQAQVTASALAREEINIAHNTPSLMRSTTSAKLALAGIAGGRRASTELADIDDETGVRSAIATLFADAASAPADESHAVSSAQRCMLEQGPLEADVGSLGDAIAALLDWRARHTPKMMVDESAIAHLRLESRTLSSAGTDLACTLGWYELGAFGTARDGSRSSSFAATGGACESLADAPIESRFGLAEMLQATERQIETRPIGGRFTGTVVLAPAAVDDLVTWLLGQLDDGPLIAGSSLFRHRVGSTVASPLFTLASRFDAPGVAAISADGWVTPPVEVVGAGTLRTLLPSLYGSRKTGLPHVPVAAGGGWDVASGSTPREAMGSGIARGAWVGRLSMGRPASNGDFSGVIKNSFAIEGGATSYALSETMITGNVARMLADIEAVSRERIDFGARRLPWLRIGGLHFS